MKYINLFWIYEYLVLTIPKIPHRINMVAIHPKRIPRMYFILAPAYRHMMSPTIPRIITVPRSGINKKIKKRAALRIIKYMKKFLLFILSRFLMSHHHTKSTYPNLKNSAGWILGRNGILIHPLDP